MNSLSKLIIFEDSDIVLINKPPGLVVNNAGSVSGETVQNLFVEYLKKLDLVSDSSDISFSGDKNTWQKLVPSDFDLQYGTPEEIFTERQGLVHRLDKDTSGVMILAKNPGALVNLMHQFRLRETKKEYLCLVHGKFQIDVGSISAPLGRARVNRKKFAVVTDGRASKTFYKVIKHYPDLDWTKIEKLFGNENKLKTFKKACSTYQQGFSLVECYPKTGRTHQIRVHMAHIRHSLVGDVTYVGKKRAKLDPVWCPRQFLHASKIEFIHPRSSEKVVFEAVFPEDLEEVLEVVI